MTKSGTPYILWIGPAGGVFIKIKYRTPSGWVWDNPATNLYTHAPQIWSQNDDVYAFLGHDDQIRFGYDYHLAGQSRGRRTRISRPLRTGRWTVPPMSAGIRRARPTRTSSTRRSSMRTRTTTRTTSPTYCMAGRSSRSGGGGGGGGDVHCAGGVGVVSGWWFVGVGVGGLSASASDNVGVAGVRSSAWMG